MIFFSAAKSSRQAAKSRNPFENSYCLIGQKSIRKEKEKKEKGKKSERTPAAI
jgi:hypothetical protein